MPRPGACRSLSDVSSSARTGRRASMSRQTVLLIAVLGAAIGVPYLLMDDGLGFSKLRWSGPKNDGALAVPGSTAADPAGAFAPGDPAAMPGQPLVAQPQIEGPRVADFSEVIRFDVTPKWVLSRWSRVSTQMA